ncbi:MAG: hypothetical protein ACRES8_09050 [Nevskiaceae bacterium]
MAVTITAHINGASNMLFTDPETREQWRTAALVTSRPRHRTRLRAVYPAAMVAFLVRHSPIHGTGVFAARERGA